MKIFSGSSNPGLAKKVAKKLGRKLGQVELSDFPNKEVRVWIKEGVSRHRVFILQSLNNTSEKFLVELCLMADAIKRQGAKEIIAIIPWLAYIKQDKVFRPGEPLSAKIITNIIQSASFSSLLTFDLHNIAVVGFFDISVVHLSALPILEKKIKSEATNRSLVLSIGAGGSKLSADLAKNLNLPLAYLDSRRDLKTGKVAVNGVSQKIAGQEIIIIDDMIATGSTLLRAAEFLKKEKVKKITVAVTHHLFIPGVAEKLEKSKIDRLIVADTVQKPEGLRLKKTKIISVAPLIAKYIRKNS